MKSVTLLKQRLLYKREAEDPEFLRLKKETLAMREHLVKAAGFLKAWLEGAKAMQKASKDMSEIFSGEDPDLEAIARTVSEGLANTQTGAGVIEVALDSVNRKIGYMNELKKKGEQLDVAHLELSRANRKVHDAKDSAKQGVLIQEQERAQHAYDSLRRELEASYIFVLNEAKNYDMSGQPHPLGLLHQELAAFKLSQVAFYKACNDVTSHFRSIEVVDVASVWADFQNRRLAAVEAAAVPSPTKAHAQSGRDLFRQGLDGGGSERRQSDKRQSSQRSAPPPPPPPAAAAVTKHAAYAYTAAGDDELSFEAGDELTILDDKGDPNWWMAETASGHRGLVPSNYLS